MWMKDENGNWYMAGQESINTCCSPRGCWTKDTAGGWVHIEEAPGFDGRKLAVSAEKDVLVDRVV